MKLDKLFTSVQQHIKPSQDEEAIQALHQCMDIYEGIDRMIDRQLAYMTLVNVKQYQIMCLGNRYFYDEPINNTNDHLQFKYHYQGQDYWINASPNRHGGGIFMYRQV